MPESVSRLWNLVSLSAGHLSTAEMIVRIALICCSLFASVQLLSMWGTHYGDHNATSKSFFLSLLLHCCFGLGWATVIDSMPRIAAAPGEPAAPTVRVTLTQDNENLTESGTSSRSVFSPSTQPLDTELTRMQRPEQELSPLETPVVEQVPTTDPVVPETPDLPARLEVQTPAPTQQLAPNSVAMSPARPSADIDQPAPEARPETQNVTAASRQQLNRESSSIDLSTRIEPQRGASERRSPLIEDGAVLTLPNELVPEASVPKPVGATDDLIRRRSNPVPAPAEIAESGSSPSSASAITTGNRRTDKFARSGSRTSTDPEFEPSPPARSPSSVSNVPRDQVIASRASIGTEIPGQNPGPQLARPDSSPIASRTPTRNPEPYRSRRIEQRRAIALKNGGSEQSERAVEASLRWMAGIQEPAGYWSAGRHGGGADKRDPQGQDRKDGGLHADAGITGLVVLSYLGAGYTHEEGKYSEVTLRAIKWLIGQQKSNGYLGGIHAADYDKMYCHAMATFALAEAYGMQNDPNSFAELHEAVRSGAQLICDMQNNDGGWRYGKGSESDMSMFGWQLMALKSAVNAGIPVPDETLHGMTRFLQARALGTQGGLAGYKARERASPSMTAEALFCRQMFSARPGDAASQEAVEYLRQNLPRLSAYDEYYWYYGTLAMFQHDGRPWEDWNGALRDLLIGQQRTQGPLAGSWDPKGKWAGIGGRLYSTAVSTMCLEVYYRSSFADRAKRPNW